MRRGDGEVQRRERLLAYSKMDRKEGDLVGNGEMRDASAIVEHGLCKAMGRLRFRCRYRTSNVAA